MRERVTVAMLSLLLIASIAVGLLHAFAERRPGDADVLSTAGRSGVAVVNLFGMISGPESESLLGTVGGVDAIVSSLEWAGRLDRAKAVVIRINSPGGSVGATQEIHEAVKRLRGTGKPIVVSVSEICASGGYYAACPADAIVANPGAVVGSIGVILYAPNFRGLLEDKLGIRLNVVASGKWKDAGSPFREMTGEERERFQKMIDAMYGQFLDAVIEGRAPAVAKDLAGAEGLSLAQARARVADTIRQSAEGQIFTAAEAKDRYLLDEIGPYPKALEVARRLAALPADAPVITRTKAPLKTLLEMIEARGRSPLAEQMQKIELGARLEYRYVPGI